MITKMERKKPRCDEGITRKDWEKEALRENKSYEFKGTLVEALNQIRKEGYAQGKKDAILDMRGKSYYNLGKIEAYEEVLKDATKVMYFRKNGESHKSVIMELFIKRIEQRIKKLRGEVSE